MARLSQHRAPLAAARHRVLEQQRSVSQERKEKLERLGMASLSIFGLGIISFLLYTIFTKLMLTQGAVVAILAVLAAIVFLGSGLASVFLFAKANELKDAAGKRQLDAPGDPTGKLLDAHEQPAFSIADRTTDLLPAVDAKKHTSE